MFHLFLLFVFIRQTALPLPPALLPLTHIPKSLATFYTDTTTSSSITSKSQTTFTTTFTTTSTTTSTITFIHTFTPIIFPRRPISKNRSKLKNFPAWPSQTDPNRHWIHSLPPSSESSHKSQEKWLYTSPSENLAYNNIFIVYILLYIFLIELSHCIYFTTTSLHK